MNKQPLNYRILMYMGKEWCRDFKNDDGTITKSYKYLFKKTPTDQYPVTFWGFDKTKGVELLEEGEIVIVGYVEKPNPKGQSPIKNVRCFCEPDNDNNNNNNNLYGKKSNIEFDEVKFAKAYQQSDKIKIDEKNVEHFIGTLIKKNPNCKELFDRLNLVYNEYVMGK